MPVDTAAVGKAFPPATFAVGREKVKEYALAVGETNPVHLDPDAAKAAGYADVVAPPMFAVVYSAPAVAPGLFDRFLTVRYAGASGDFKTRSTSTRSSPRAWACRIVRNAEAEIAVT